MFAWEDQQSEECICEPPRACLCWSRPSGTVERDTLYAYQGLKDPAKDAEPVGDHSRHLYIKKQATYTRTITWTRGSKCSS